MAVATPRSVRLGRQLAALRAEAGMTAARAATQVGKTQSWLSRIESGTTKISLDDLRLLLGVYGLRAADRQFGELMALAEHLEEQRWFARPGTLPHKYLTYIAYEGEALRVREWEPVLIPGLLQTRAYAQAVLEVGWSLRAGVVEERLEARMARKEVLTRDDRPVRLHAIISEVALRCEVGGPKVRDEQVRHLRAAVAMPNVTIQILPLTAGAHVAGHAGFTLLDFGSEEPSLGFADGLTGGWFVEAPDEVGWLDAVFDQLASRAMSPEESNDWMWEEPWRPQS